MSSKETVDLGIVDALAQLSFAVQNALARRAAAYELSMTQVRLMGVLRDRTAGMQQIAGLLELDKSSVTGLVDRAVKRGLVVKQTSTDDRRVSRVELTAEGHRIARMVGEEFGGDVLALLAGIDAADIAALSRIASDVIVESGRHPAVE
ncbi:MarR family winged helix-turn-helix transcriptional regulator [Antrihabitans cavernicola]|uniref:MarR family transcriptional regulator n=1 Tax=Antrihabitans cavernicola TaxID=2495913 RepID=A0A5A7SA41_9NOCA|nr:MarR family transcriptional regulator [Spelaeibacter cavernicola]KAA0021405.1 MarR family transcriptional regulator [Spelaeibacter cavernicola]